MKNTWIPNFMSQNSKILRFKLLIKLQTLFTSQVWSINRTWLHNIYSTHSINDDNHFHIKHQIGRISLHFKHSSFEILIATKSRYKFRRLKLDEILIILYDEISFFKCCWWISIIQWNWKLHEQIHVLQCFS